VLVVIGRAPPIYRDGADAVARRYDVDLASDDKARGGAKLDHEIYAPPRFGTGFGSFAQ
jgi:hypothetical protein